MTLFAGPASSRGMALAFGAAGASFFALGAWLAGGVLVPGVALMVLGGGGLAMAVVIGRPSAHGIHLDARGFRTRGPAGPIEARYDEIAAMQRADLLLAPGVPLARHLVLLEDGRHFFVDHRWQRAHEALACLAHRRLDAPPFDPRADDGPNEVDPEKTKKKIARLMKRIAETR